MRVTRRSAARLPRAAPLTRVQLREPLVDLGEKYELLDRIVDGGVDR
jgi:hypothetical protein